MTNNQYITPPPQSHTPSTYAMATIRIGLG